MKSFLILTLLVVLVGCSKMEEKKPTVTPGSQQNQNQTGQQDGTQNPHGNFDSKTTSTGDNQAENLKQQADDSYAVYKKEASDYNKQDAINKNMAAGMYYTYDADLPPKDKYKPALRFFRVVLELDPDNKDAKENKEKIEEIYTMMGKPVPQD
jgi:lipoprotein NlpI